MKKIFTPILFAAMAMMSIVAAHAVTDGQIYEAVNGIKIANQWIFDRVHTSDAYMENPICNQRARTAVMSDGVIYVARSEAQQAIVGTDTISQSIIYRFNAADGSSMSPLPVTLNGRPYGAFLGVASIGRDNFGHLWVAPMTSNVQMKIPVYQLNAETGELTLITEMDKGDAPQRTDYLDVMGDITREKAECNIMTAAGASAAPGFPQLYRWHAEMGSDVFEGGFDGDPYVAFTIFYPETKTGFSLAPVVKMCLGSSPESMYSGELFYIDCFDTAPVLYDVSGSVVDSFEGVDSSLQPQFSANGVTEFTIENRNMLAYAKAAYDGNGNGCQLNVVELGEGQSLGGMTKYWQLPADSLGKVSDGGLRVNCYQVDKSEEAGSEVATLFMFKAYNGMGVYKIGKNVGGDTPTPLTGDVNKDGIVNVSDVTELINMILGSATPDAAVGDLNGDGTINVSDVTELINIILASA